MPIQLEDIPVISKSQLQKVMIIGTHLHQWQSESLSGVDQVIAAQGFVQIDPLNPAGRNHDHFFFGSNAHLRTGNGGKTVIFHESSI